MEAVVPDVTASTQPSLPPERPPSNVVDLSRVPQWLVLAVALGGGASGLSALGLQASDSPPASQAQLAALEEQIDALDDAVRELSYQIRRYHDLE